MKRFRLIALITFALLVAMSFSVFAGGKVYVSKVVGSTIRSSEHAKASFTESLTAFGYTVVGSREAADYEAQLTVVSANVSRSFNVASLFLWWLWPWFGFTSVDGNATIAVSLTDVKTGQAVFNMSQGDHVDGSAFLGDFASGQKKINIAIDNSISRIIATFPPAK